MKIDIVHVDTCLPDYWGGHHLPHVQIPVWRGIHLSEIKAAIRSEILEGALAGADDDARLLAGVCDGPAEEKRADRLYRAALAAAKRVTPAVKRKRRLFNDLENSRDDDGDTIYAFFVLEIIE